jgi:crotonobetainyl-CoA:carnitine CoA-transferase CaiB-like acyl-CoA transferase
MAHFSIEQYHRYFVTGLVPNTTDRGRVSQSFAFACGDGALLAVHLSSPVKFWEGFLRAIATPELASDSRFATRMGRVRNHEALEASLRPVFASRPRAQWLARLAAEDVPHAPIHDLEQALADPQMRHLDVERTLHHPTQGAVRTLRTPIAFDGVRREIVSPPPALDQHGESIRAELAQRKRDRKKR